MVLLVGALLLAPGCGGGDSSEGGKIEVETGTLSEAEFARQADARCDETEQEFNHEFRNLVGRLGAQDQAGERVEIRAFVEEKIIPLYEGLIEEISQLGTPQRSRQRVTAFLKELRSKLNLAAREPVRFFGTLNPLMSVMGPARDAGLNGCAATFR